MTLTAFVLWAPLKARVFALLDPYSINGDAYQHIAPMWFSRQSNDTVADYTARYYLKAIIPPVFKWTYAVATIAYAPAIAAKIITVLLSFGFITLSALSAFRLAGASAAALAFFMASAGVIKSMPFMGGIQRGFGFFLLSLALYLGIQGRLVGLMVLSVVATSFYPAAGVFLLTTLGLLSLLPKQYRGSISSWGLKKRFVSLGLSAVFSALTVAPLLWNGSEYGERLSISAEREFAEWGPRGRYTQGDRGVPTDFFVKVPREIANLISGVKAKRTARLADESAISDALYHLENRIEAGIVMLLTAAIGLVLLVKYRSAISPHALRCLIFGVAMPISFLAATLSFPLLYIPSRYIGLGVVCLTPVIFPAIWGAAIHALSFKLKPALKEVTTAICGALIIIYLGWPWLQVKRLSTFSAHGALLSFIDKLPGNVVIASWPVGVINAVPLYTGKQVLVFGEGHQVFHRDFLLEMRRRTRAIIAAYSAVTPEPIIALARDYKVTHLIINSADLISPPEYFEPFGSESRQARQMVGSSPLFLSELIRDRAVFKSARHTVVDIQNLATASVVTPSE